MGRRGPGALPQVEKRELYARLIAQGYNNSEACRIVGINRRTGKRWRHGRTITTRDGRKLHYAAVVAAGAGRRVREISDRYLSEQERVRIADLRQAGHGVRAIAEQTGRSPSTISRELRRNRDPDNGQYRPFTAHKLAARRRARPRPGKIAADPVLRQFVAGRLEKRWSPEQVSRALRREFPESRPACRARDDLPGDLRPSGRAAPRAAGPVPAHRPGAAQAAPAAGRAAAERDHRDDHDQQRPAEAADRAVPGHWEGDLIVGRVQPVGDRHPGGAGDAVHDAAAPARTARPPRRSATR